MSGLLRLPLIHYPHARAHRKYYMALEKTPHRVTDPPASWRRGEATFTQRRNEFGEGHPMSSTGTGSSASTLYTADQRG